MKPQSERSVMETFESPYFIKLTPNLWAVQFRFMKVVPARYIFERAVETGAVIPGKTTIIETTSGNFGIGLALVCQRYGNPLIIVSEPSLNPHHRKRLHDLGAKIVIVTKADVGGGYQRGRLQRVKDLLEKHSHSFWPQQYDEPNNSRAYASIAEQIIDEIGFPDALVGPVGSGGSMCGTSRFLRLANPSMRSIAVDTHGSVAFGHEDRPRLMGGLGNSVFPANLDHTAFDDVHWVTAAEGFRATRELHQRHAVYAGGSSGAAFLAARWYAQRHIDEKVVVIFPDQGERYASTIYDDSWLKRHAWLDHSPSEPVVVFEPRSCPDAWSVMKWARRSYSEVMSQRK